MKDFAFKLEYSVMRTLPCECCSEWCQEVDWSDSLEQLKEDHECELDYYGSYQFYKRVGDGWEALKDYLK